MSKCRIRSAYQIYDTNVACSMDVVVQPSVPWMSLNDQIKDSGLFFPVDPGPSVRSHVLHYIATNKRKSQSGNPNLC